MSDMNELVERKTKTIKLYLLDTEIYHHAKDMTEFTRGLVLEALDDPLIVFLDDDQSFDYTSIGYSVTNHEIIQAMLKAGFKKVKTTEEKS